MSLRRISAANALSQLEAFDALIDARSESEFAEDHLPGAVNWPSLSDSERHRIGTEYAQSPFEARKHGAALVARNIAGHIDSHLGTVTRGWRPLVYCWRGGQRSGALGSVLDQIGFGVQVIDGGYREFRRAVIAELETRPAGLGWRVVCGRTGSAKSRLLQVLQREGAQVLDLEGLARHRGSVLGPLPGQPQPSQKAFETALWAALRGFDPARPVFVEGESRTIGRLRVPEHLLERLREASCVQVTLPLAQRVSFLLEDYAHYVGDVDSLCERLSALREVRGAAVVCRWQEKARAGAIAEVVGELLAHHYDPIYDRSMHRHFTCLATAWTIALTDASPEALTAASRALMLPPSEN